MKGSNIVLTAEDGGIKVATAQDLVLNSVKMGNTTVSKDGMIIVAPTASRTVVLNSAGLNNGGNKITNVLAGTDDTDAVNVKQLKLANTTIDRGLNFGGDSGDPVNRKLGETLTVKGGDTINADPATKNISVTANGEDILTVRLAKDINLGETGSVTTGNTQVNNAGITRDNLLLRMSEDDWDDILNIHLKAVYRLSKRVLKGMTKARFGRIINVSSVVAHFANPGQANYSAAKAGIEAFSRSLAKEMGSRQITVNSVAPGFIATEMTDTLSEDLRKKMSDQVALGRLGEPQDIANAVSFLASDKASYITGTVLHVNGGLYMN